MLVSLSAARRYVLLWLAPAAFLCSGLANASCDQYSPHVLNALASQYQYEIVTAARSNGVNPNLLKAVITAESCFRPDAVSPKGAGGLMQLMPATARRFGVADRFDTTENIHGGARYLRWLLTRYQGSIPHAVAAYNAGEGRVDVYGTAVPIEETQTYTRRVLNAYQKLSGGYRQQPQVRRPHIIRGNRAARCEVVTHSLYTIHGNETLQHVARRYGMDVRRLAALNKIARPYTVEHGQRLRVEVCGRWVDGTETHASGSEWSALAAKIRERTVNKPAVQEKDDRWGFDF